MNVKKTMELKDEWCEKSWEYEGPLTSFMDFLKEEDEDWIDYEKLEPVLKKTIPSENWIQSFSKKILTYKLQKSDFQGFEELEELNNLTTIYMHFKKKLTESHEMYKAIYDREKGFISQLDWFDGHWLDDFEDKIVSLMTLWMEQSVNMKELRDLIDDFEWYTRNSHYKTILLDRIKREFDATMEIEHEITENEWKAIKLYEKKKKEVDPKRKPKRYGWKK